MRKQYIIDLKEFRLPRKVGNKGRSVHFLLDKHFQTPPTYVCTWDVHERYMQNDPSILHVVREELVNKIDPTKHYAVRSSANLEDGKEYSFAGQFKSFLHIQGIEEILRAIEMIMLSTTSPAVQSYLEKTGIKPHDLRMAVLIQEMVQPKISGVSFSKNPITGMDEVLVEAVRGSGEALVQQGVNPGRWINKWGEWIVKPEDGDIPLEIIDEVVSQTRRIAHVYKGDVDLEWVHDGKEIFWVQLRPITALKDIPVYSNYISREVLPGIIKPLVWSVNVSVVNWAWKDFLEELTGRKDIDAGSLAKPFYYRAYFNMGTIGIIFETLGLPRETIELLMGIQVEGSEKPSIKPTLKSLLLLPRLLWFAAHKVRYALRCKSFLSSVEGEFLSFPRDEVRRWGEQELLFSIERINATMRSIAYSNIVIQLFMGLFTVMLKRLLKIVDRDFESIDLSGENDELNRYSPLNDLGKLHGDYQSLKESQKERMRSGGYSEFRELPGIQSFQEKFELFLNKFGYMSDGGNDFSKVPWRENPDLILSMIKNYKPAEQKPLQKFRARDLNVPLPRRFLIERLYRAVCTFRLYREEVSFLTQLGHDLTRMCFLALGHHLMNRGFLEEKEDTFYLSFEEVRKISETEVPESAYARLVARRKSEIEACRDISLPYVIYGDYPPFLKEQEVKKLKGMPTSRGRYQGFVKRVQGINDFNKVKEGDVLVIPYSDAGWTPLFTKASAIVAESGGMLSHSSIIAREYCIPAVVSVSGLHSLHDNMLVTVDGYNGEIIIHEPMNVSPQ